MRLAMIELYRTYKSGVRFVSVCWSLGWSDIPQSNVTVLVTCQKSLVRKINRSGDRVFGKDSANFCHPLHVDHLHWMVGGAGDDSVLCDPVDCVDCIFVDVFLGNEVDAFLIQLSFLFLVFDWIETFIWWQEILRYFVYQ